MGALFPDAARGTTTTTATTHQETPPPPPLLDSLVLFLLFSLYLQSSGILHWRRLEGLYKEIKVSEDYYEACESMYLKMIRKTTNIIKEMFNLLNHYYRPRI